MVEILPLRSLTISTPNSVNCSMSLRSVLGSAVISCCFKNAEISARETGWDSSVVSQRYLNMRSVRFVSISLSAPNTIGNSFLLRLEYYDYQNLDLFFLCGDFLRCFYLSEWYHAYPRLGMNFVISNPWIHKNTNPKTIITANTIIKILIHFFIMLSFLLFLSALCM